MRLFCRTGWPRTITEKHGDRNKINEIFLINCFVFIITLVWKTVHSSAMTPIKAHLMEKTLQLTVPK